MTYDEELGDRMRRHLRTKKGVVEKNMFGGIGFLFNGNMACGVHKQDLIVRLSDAAFNEAVKQPNVRIFNMTGRPMKGWIMVSKPGYDSETALKDWIDKACQHARSLPPK